MNTLKVVLLRVGCDSGCGGMQGPLLDTESNFEYIPIPDYTDTDERKYGTQPGRHGRMLVEYFPRPRQPTMRDQSIHYDPEFRTSTYGDPTTLKAGLRHLVEGDMLVFYCGLEGWGDFWSKPALFIMGYFEVKYSRLAREMDENVQSEFNENFHVRHPKIYLEDKETLVLVKGSHQSRILNFACLISEMGKDRNGAPLKILSRKMRNIFGDFNGHVGIQRSSPRWVSRRFVNAAAEFVRSLD